MYFKDFKISFTEPDGRALAADRTAKDGNLTKEQLIQPAIYQQNNNKSNLFYVSNAFYFCSIYYLRYCL